MSADGDNHPQSGLDYLRERLKDWHGSAMAETMNMRLIAVEDGSAHGLVQLSVQRHVVFAGKACHFGEQ